ncbi:hypothetical protein [Salinithrix halophila]|uniref:Uncharacterized protein n=1 Tax=Salinithrix halophila TaxID=1485204 RepID=A0ABV8JH67_9BACL
MSYKKMKCVSFDMAERSDRALYDMVSRNREDFSDLVKKLLFSWAYGYQKPEKEEPRDQGEDIRNSGVPFG